MADISWDDRFRAKVSVTEAVIAGIFLARDVSVSVGLFGSLRSLRARTSPFVIADVAHS